MTEHDNVPLLTDLIEKGIEITMSDLGFDEEELVIEGEPPPYPVIQSPATETPFDHSVVTSAAADPDKPSLSNTEMALLDREIREIIDLKIDEAMFDIRRLIQSKIGK